MTEPLVEIINRRYVKGAHKAIRPVDAASIMLVDRREGSPKVLMGRRNPAAKFMPGFFVFPGGRFEASDSAIAHHGGLNPRDLERMAMMVSRPSLRRSRGLALAAIRETFEETGLRIGAAAARPLPEPDDAGWRAFVATGMLPNLDNIRFMARAITPPGRNRRFDTRFFMLDVSGIADLTTIRPNAQSELVELVWVPLKDAGTVESAEITRIIVGELQRLIDGGLAEELPRPFYRMRHGKFQRIGL